MVANLFTLVIDHLRFVKISHTLEACRGLEKLWCNVLGTLKSSCLHPVFGPLFTPYPLFEWGPQSKEVLLNLGMKCWNSAFNAQFDVIIIVVHVGVVKIYVTPVEAMKEKGSKSDETQFGTKSGAFLRFSPFKANALFYMFSFNLSRFWTKLRVLVLCFPGFTEYSISSKGA